MSGQSRGKRVETAEQEGRKETDHDDPRKTPFFRQMRKDEVGVVFREVV